MKIWLNGEIVSDDKAVVSVLDHGVLYGDGVFEGIRVYGGRVFQAQAHIDRLFESANKLRLASPYTKQELIDAMDQTVAAEGVPDAYIRLVVTRGPGTLGLSPFRCSNPVTFIIVDQIALYPEEMYRKGMAVIVAKTVRTSARMLDPSIKSLNYLNNIMGKIEAVDAGVAEAIMLNEKGFVAECTGDNIFMVADGALFSPPEEAGILKGITRRVVMMLADRLGIGVQARDIRPEELYQADECFLTGTAAEVISVTRIDGRTIGSGQPGPITGRLLEAFRQYIRSGQSL